MWAALTAGVACYLRRPASARRAAAVCAMKNITILLVSVLWSMFYDATCAFNVLSKTVFFSGGISPFTGSNSRLVSMLPKTTTLRSRLVTKPKINMSKSLPRDIKETINQLRQSMQAGLSARCSRMDIELPYAVNFGIERSTQSSQALNLQCIQQP